MARPSRKAERTDQILDAVEFCLARYGLQGATLERIAEAAELARPLLRHNVGNRETMLRQCLERFMSRSDEELLALCAQLPAQGPRKKRADTLLCWLLDPEYHDPQEVRVLEAFTTWAQDDPEIGARIVALNEQFIEILAQEFARSYPQAGEQELLAVATAVSALYLQIASLSTLGELEALRQASVVAGRRLLATLSLDPVRP